MTDKLPHHLLALFAARPPLRWLPPLDYPPEKRCTQPITGLAAYLPALQAYKETDTYEATESWLQRKDRVKLEKKQAIENLKKEGPEIYKPNEDPNIRGDAFKTLIAARLDYKVTEDDLEREFGRFGPIERIRIVTNTHPDPAKKQKPHRGYAFILFEREKDMRAALERCDDIRIKDRRIKVDVARGRTVPGWLPRRLGGGLGGRGYTKASAPRGGGGGFGGGGGPGGFRGGGFRGFDGPRGGGRGGFRGPGGFGGGGGGGGRSGGPRGDRGINGSGPPSNAPSGPGGRFGGGRSYDDRSHRDDRPAGTGSNMEPVRPRDRDHARESRDVRDRDHAREPRDYRDRGDRDRGDRDRDRDRDRGGDRRDRDHQHHRGDRDHDRDGGYRGDMDRDSRKRGFEGGGYEDPRKLRRY